MMNEDNYQSYMKSFENQRDLRVIISSSLELKKGNRNKLEPGYKSEQLLQLSVIKKFLMIMYL